MNSRILEPLIWPPNRNDTSNETSSDLKASPSVAWTLRMARPMRCATWNMVGAFISVSSSPVWGSSTPSVRVDSTDWLIARLPALAIAMMRSPGLLKIWSLRKVETLSRPALVRVSAIITNPSRTNTPQQYVIPGPRTHQRARELLANFRGGSNHIQQLGRSGRYRSGHCDCD